MTINQLEITESEFQNSLRFRIKRTRIAREFWKAFLLGAALCLVTILFSL